MSDAGSARSIEAKRLQLNLKVLQRHDPSIVEILDSTSYVVLYKYVPAPNADAEDPADMQWVKTSIEGSMFVFRRTQAPYYGFFILNRHGVENFSHYLEDEANLELTPEYIIVQDGEDQIKGIWVFEEDHRDRLGQKMLELSRLSKQGNTMSKAAASVPSHASNNDSPSSATSAMPLPAGQSISLDMLFGSSLGGGSSNNGNPQISMQSTSNTSANEPNLGEQQPSSSNAPSSNNNNSQGISLLDSLFADMSGNAGNVSSAKASPDHRVNLQPTNTSDEDALRNLLGLGSVSPRHQSKPSPGPYHQQLQPSPQQRSTPPVSSHYLSQSQRPQQSSQTILEPLAPRPQKLAQFDSVEYEPPIQQQQQPPYQQQPYMAGPPPMAPMHGMSYEHQPTHPPPPPHLAPHHPSHDQHQQPQRQAPMPNPTFNSAPLMPSVLLNKKPTGQQPSPQHQQRVLPPPQQQHQQHPAPSFNQPYSHQQQPAQAPQYSPTNPSFSKYGPPPVLRVKSPLRQSQTFSYASSDYSNSDTRFGAQSIQPPPVPPVESRPAQMQQQPQRQNSGERVQQALSPRSSPQRQEHPLSATHVMDVLSDTLQKTQIYQSTGSSHFDRLGPLNKEDFRRQLYGFVQDERFFEGLYRRYLETLRAK
ncbi:hypothetical protein P389DRAFT_89061 [Cystobasidium minutum MCA 4210]|uniref:uncharacterized protein n=1 Tax=Cystobasidium minutum MCA 4210 TaxID=1397322 RepID=UPI0034CD0FD1|eukprot:jgi/Rhomi1/89061/CE89060_800